MSLCRFNTDADSITIFLEGHIDSTNANNVESEINVALSGGPFGFVTVDCDGLKYISSAGLRIILRLRKEYPALKLINVSPDVYEIFDVTGFTEMLDIQKGYRHISVDGCEVIGEGANGKVYRIDRDTIVKVYRDADSLPAIQRERELARKAFVMGIPTAIPYDVVRVNDSYGSVFELLNADSFANILAKDPSRFDEIADQSVALLKKLHSTELKHDEMPDIRIIAKGWVEDLKNDISGEQYVKLRDLLDEMPEDDHMIHGDFHIKNVMMQDGEVLLIDMDTLCLGHPVFEFAAIYNAYVGFTEIDHTNVERFLGIPYDTSIRLWSTILSRYLGENNTELIASVSDKAALVGYVRLLRRHLRHARSGKGLDQAGIDCARGHIAELLEKVDTLLF